MLMETKDTPEAIKTLETMLAIWPDRPNYWKQLGSIYLNEEEEERALAVFEVALAGGYLTQEADILRVVGLCMFLDLPVKAASILEGKMAQGIVPRTLKNLETLGNAWLRAQETEKAIATYREATAVEGNARLDLLAAQLLSDLERWDDAIASLQHLLEDPAFRTQLPNPGLAYMLLGNAFFETNRLTEAKQAFQAGLEFSAVRTACQQWIESIEATEAAQAAVRTDPTE
jgi:tetratricopeptide (TPR) repeat protein